MRNTHENSGAAGEPNVFLPHKGGVSRAADDTGNGGGRASRQQRSEQLHQLCAVLMMESVRCGAGERWRAAVEDDVISPVLPPLRSLPASSPLLSFPFLLFASSHCLSLQQLLTAEGLLLRGGGGGKRRRWGHRGGHFV